MTKKLTFKKDLKSWQTVAVICSTLCIILFCFLNKSSIASMSYLLLFLPLLIYFFKTYAITDEQVLIGNGEIPIHNILKIVYEPHQITHGFIHNPNWVTVYYVETKEGKTKVKRFYPKDAEGFIRTLTGINHHIQVI